LIHEVRHIPIALGEEIPPAKLGPNRFLEEL
jgi:hypothetical protein